MKKLLIVMTGLLFVFIIGTHAQTAAKKKHTIAEFTSVGPVIGFQQNWVGNMGGINRYMPGGNIGIDLVYARQEHWGLGGMLTLSWDGYRKDYGAYTAMMEPTYLRLPLRAYYFFNSYTDAVRPKLFLGPELGVKLAEHDASDPLFTDAVMAQNTGSFRAMDLGLNMGGGVNVRVDKHTWLNLDLTYYQGLTDVVKDPGGRYNVNHNLGVSAGLLFGVR